MSSAAFGIVIAGGVRANAVEEDRFASDAGDWFRGTGSAQPDTHRFHKLVISEDTAVMFEHASQPHVVDFGVFQLIQAVGSDAITCVSALLRQALAKAFIRAGGEG